MEDTVSVRDVVAVLQPGEMVRRIAEEIEGHLVELGSDGRLIHLQTEELSAGVEESLMLVLRDYSDERGSPACGRSRPTPSWTCPRWWPPSTSRARTTSCTPRWRPHGYRLLHRLPQPLSETLIERLVQRFGSLPEILSASAAELESVDGIGAATARHVRDGLARLVEASIFERYE